MKKFKVFVKGNNCLIREVKKTSRKCGFYTTAYTEAPNAEQAEAIVVELLRNDFKLQNLCENNASDPPIIRIETVDEIESFDGCTLPRMGFAFFEEEA